MVCTVAATRCLLCSLAVPLGGFFCVYVRCVRGREQAREGGRGVGGMLPRWWKGGRGGGMVDGGGEGREGGCSPPGPTSSANLPHPRAHAYTHARVSSSASQACREGSARSGDVCLFGFVFLPRHLVHGGQIGNAAALPDGGGGCHQLNTFSRRHLPHPPKQYGTGCRRKIMMVETMAMKMFMPTG